MQIERCTPQTVIGLYDFSGIATGNLAAIKTYLLHQYNAETLDHFATTGTFLNPLRIYLDIPNRLASFRESHPELFAPTDAKTPTERTEPVEPPAESFIFRPVESASSVSSSAPRTPSNPTSEPGFSSDIQGKLLALLAPGPSGHPGPPGTPSNKPDKADKAEKSVSQMLKNPAVLRQFADYVQKNYEPSAEPKVKFMDLLKDFREVTGTYLGDKWNPRYEALCQAIGLRVEKITGTGYYKSGTYYAYLKVKLPTIGAIPILPQLSATPSS